MADRDYLMQHKVPELIDRLIIKLVKAKPSNPQQFLANCLQSDTTKYSAPDEFPDLSRSRSALTRALTTELFAQLRDRRTSAGFTLDSCIQPGVDDPSDSVGVVAGDEESYEVFSELFNLVITEIHGGWPPEGVHRCELDPSKVTTPPLDDKYIASTRVSVLRNLRGISLGAGITRGGRRAVEEIVVRACKSLTGELAGTYYALPRLVEAEVEEKLREGVLFSARRARDWPDARGTFHNDARSFAVWVNEREHARIVAVQRGGDVTLTFRRLSEGSRAIDDALRQQGQEWSFSDHLGFIQSNPADLGTGLVVSLLCRLPNLSRHAQFSEILQKFRLVASPPHDEFGESGLVEVTNADRLGKTEVEIVLSTVDGMGRVIELERACEAGESIDARW